MRPSATIDRPLRARRKTSPGPYSKMSASRPDARIGPGVLTSPNASGDTGPRDGRDDRAVPASFDRLLEEACAVPVEGWDFGWLAGRATEERPPWGYARLLAERAATATRLLDLQTGGGEPLGSVPRLPPLTVATEGFAPNLRRASGALRRRGAWVVAVASDAPDLPFGTEVFDLVVSRHPVTTPWDAVCRILTPGGRFLSQQVGPHSMRELTEWFTGPQPTSSARSPEQAVTRAHEAGLEIGDVITATLRATFSDVGAVVYFLRLVVWTVPDFSVARFRDRLLALHHEIEVHGPFVAHATRFLLDAVKPA